MILISLGVASPPKLVCSVMLEAGWISCGSKVLLAVRGGLRGMMQALQHIHVCIYIYIHVCMYVCMYVYIYICIHRERERDTDTLLYYSR